MNLRNVSPMFLQELQAQLSRRNVDLGDVEIREWVEFPYEGFQVLVFGARNAPTWFVDTSCANAYILGGLACHVNDVAAAKIADGIAAFLKEDA